MGVCTHTCLLCVCNILHGTKFHLEGAFQISGTRSVPGMETTSFCHECNGNYSSYPVQQTYSLFYQASCIADIDKPATYHLSI